MLAGSATGNVTKLSLASEQMQAAEHSPLCRLLSSDDFNHHRDVAMSITVSISAVRSHMPDIDGDEILNSCCSPSLISISVGADHPCHPPAPWSLRSFSLTRTIFSSIHSHFARIQSSRSQYFTSTDHSHAVFIHHFTEGLLQKASKLIRPPLIGSTAVTSHAAVNSDARSIQIYSKNILIRC